jgi:hypothetical protein
MHPNTELNLATLGTTPHSLARRHTNCIEAENSPKLHYTYSITHASYGRFQNKQGTLSTILLPREDSYTTQPCAIQLPSLRKSTLEKEPNLSQLLPQETILPLA